jgi:hypothetical protein
VWEWHGPAVDTGDATAEWFSAHLGKPVRLVRYGGKLQFSLCKAGSTLLCDVVRAFTSSGRGSGVMLDDQVASVSARGAAVCRAVRQWGPQL